MILISGITGLVIFSTLCRGHQLHVQSPVAAGPLEELWHHSLPGDGGTQVSANTESSPNKTSNYFDTKQG